MEGPSLSVRDFDATIYRKCITAIFFSKDQAVDTSHQQPCWNEPSWGISSLIICFAREAWREDLVLLLWVQQSDAGCGTEANLGVPSVRTNQNGGLDNRMNLSVTHQKRPFYRIACDGRRDCYGAVGMHEACRVMRCGVTLGHEGAHTRRAELDTSVSDLNELWPLRLMFSAFFSHYSWAPCVWTGFPLFFFGQRKTVATFLQSPSREMRRFFWEAESLGLAKTTAGRQQRLNGNSGANC